MCCTKTSVFKKYIDTSIKLLNYINILNKKGKKHFIYLDRCLNIIN